MKKLGLHYPMTIVCLFALALCSGCISNKSLKVSNLAGRNAKVVPVRAQPILVMSENLWLVGAGTLAGGIPGALAANSADQGTTAGKRNTLKERLNADSSQFKPEAILAEECVKLLQSSPTARFSNITLRAEPLDLPGCAELIASETRPFKAESRNTFAWYMRVQDWLKTNPTAEYAKLASEGQPVLSVEVLFPAVRLINAKTVEMDVAIRVVDSAQMKILGNRYTQTRRKIRPIAADTEFEAFIEDFRNCANEAARQSLHDLKLL